MDMAEELSVGHTLRDSMNNFSEYVSFIWSIAEILRGK